MIRATINGQPHEFAGDLSILDAATSVGIDVPTLCHDPRLKPIGSCRMCLVQVEGRPHPLTSCNNQLSDGMAISTHTPALEHERKMLLRMLAQDHPADMFRRFPDKEFHRQSLQYGLSETDFDGDHHAELLDDSHPYIHVDMSQCILCYRCVRICEDGVSHLLPFTIQTPSLTCLRVLIETATSRRQNTKSQPFRSQKNSGSCQGDLGEVVSFHSAQTLASFVEKLPKKSGPDKTFARTIE